MDLSGLFSTFLGNTLSLNRDIFRKRKVIFHLFGCGINIVSKWKEMRNRSHTVSARFSSSFLMNAKSTVLLVLAMRSKQSFMSAFDLFRRFLDSSMRLAASLIVSTISGVNAFSGPTWSGAFLGFSLGCPLFKSKSASDCVTLLLFCLSNHYH